MSRLDASLIWNFYSKKPEWAEVSIDSANEKYQNIVIMMNHDLNQGFEVLKSSKLDPLKKNLSNLSEF